MPIKKCDTRMSSKNRFRSKRKGKSPSWNIGTTGVTSSGARTVAYTVTEDRETLMGILGNLSVRPSTASGVCWFSIQILRLLPSVTHIDPQNDSVGYEGYSRLWDWVVDFDAGASESINIPIVSKKRRKLYIGDTIVFVRIANVNDVGIFSAQLRAIQLLLP